MALLIPAFGHVWLWGETSGIIMMTYTTWPWWNDHDHGRGDKHDRNHHDWSLLFGGTGGLGPTIDAIQEQFRKPNYFMLL